MTWHLQKGLMGAAGLSVSLLCQALNLAHQDLLVLESWPFLELNKLWSLKAGRM